MSKKKTYPRAVKDIKGTVAIAELRRAHIVIGLLSLALAFVILASTIYPLNFDDQLGAVVVVLLLIVGAVSLATGVALKSK